MIGWVSLRGREERKTRLGIRGRGAEISGGAVKRGVKRKEKRLLLWRLSAGDRYLELL